MTFKSFLSLVRIPTVFSSMSNAYAGYLIAGGRELSPALHGIGAAALFIMAGMALNDVADAEVDARERPNRPIPSGAVSLRGAWTLSLAMMAAGLLMLYFANPWSAIAGAALCAAIFLYNFALKGTALGPASMGLCRLLNLFTGMSLASAAFLSPASLPHASMAALLSLWAYIALVTYLARDEVQGNSRAKARLFLAGAALWFIAWSLASWIRAGVLGAGASADPGLASRTAMPLVWLAHVLLLAGPLRNLSRDPSPRNTGKTVGAMLRFVPLADVMAMLACGVPAALALPGALWIAPAWIVGRLFYST